MARIGVAIYPEREHVLATLGLAKALRGEGHEIVYVGPEDFRHDIEREQLAYVTIAPSLPRGFFAESERRLQSLSLLDRWSGRGRWERIWLQDLLAAADDAALAEVSADLFLVDADSAFKLAIARAGYRTLEIATELPSVPTFDRAPPRYGGRRARGAASAARNRWLWNLSRSGLRDTLVSLVEGDRSWLERRRGGGEREWEAIASLFENHRASHLPTLVLAPKALDPLGSADLGFVYGPPFVDLARSEGPASRVEHQAPYALVLLGSRLADRPRLVEALESPDLEREVGKVVVLAEGEPRLEAMRRASVVVTDGRLNVIKECLMMGVPMVVCPMLSDQGDNAARVVACGAGTSFSPHSPRYSTWALTKALEHEAIRANVKRLQTVLLAETGLGALGPLITRCLAA